MKKAILSIFIISLTVAATAQVKKPAAAKPGAKPAVKTTAKLSVLDSASYGFGMAMGGSLKSAGLKTLNYDMLIKGLKETFSGAKGMITQEQAQKAIQACIADASKQQFAPNIADGKAYLDKNKTQPGVKVTPSGIQYQVITEGNGVKPFATDTVTVNYRGTLINGKEFDSSYKRGEPTSFPLNAVIPGWTEAVQLMSVGAKYRFVIPYNLAYGERAAGEDIPPYSTLIFEIELLKISKQQ